MSGPKLENEVASQCSEELASLIGFLDSVGQDWTAIEVVEETPTHCTFGVAYCKGEVVYIARYIGFRDPRRAEWRLTVGPDEEVGLVGIRALSPAEQRLVATASNEVP